MQKSGYLGFHQILFLISLFNKYVRKVLCQEMWISGFYPIRDTKFYFVYLCVTLKGPPWIVKGSVKCKLLSPKIYINNLNPRD